MNQIVIEKNRNMTHDQVVMGTLGVSLEELINAIRENRGGQFDHLYKKPAAPQKES